MPDRCLALTAALAAAILSAQSPPPSMGPSDTSPSGPITGTLPSKEGPGMGAGVVVPGSKADVTAGRGQYGIGGGKPEYVARLKERQADAVNIANHVRSGAVVPSAYASKIREALEGDILLWREAFGADRKEWKAMAREWLEKAPERSAGEWAIHRAKWFEMLESRLSAGN